MSPAQIIKVLRAEADRSGGMAALADATGMSRETLYRTLGPSGNPKITTLLALCKALGFELRVARRGAPKVSR